MKAKPSNSATYADLEALQERKRELRERLAGCSQDMNRQVRGLFSHEHTGSKGRKISSLISHSGTTIDMALLSWKLYQRFVGTKRQKKQKKQKKTRGLLSLFSR